tara:strand:+ start:785 stop:1321 length:537 start_codon:yes stop_codon:yes gene_type:complete
MGQYAGQPDFATRAVSITKSDDITPDKFLDGAAIFVGAGGTLKVIIAGTTGASVVTELVSPGYSGSNGSGYTAAAGIATDTNSAAGAGLTVDITVKDGAVATIAINAAGSGYENGDLISVAQPGSDGNALFRVAAVPGLPTTADGVEFSNIANGSFVPVIVDYVLSTGTTCGKLVAVY